MREDPLAGVYVEGLSEVAVTNPHQATQREPPTPDNAPAHTHTTARSWACAGAGAGGGVGGAARDWLDHNEPIIVEIARDAAPPPRAGSHELLNN